MNSSHEIFKFVSESKKKGSNQKVPYNSLILYKEIEKSLF